jgi:transcriptional regulator with XRE-family HTH domain
MARQPKPREPLKTEYGRTIRECRDRKGDTQESFASRMRVPRSTVSNWERGQMPHYLPDLVSYLCPAKEPSEPPAAEPEIPASDGRTVQLPLPFDPPIHLELRISPQRADTLHFEVVWKDKVS